MSLAPDARSTDFVTVPRASVEGSWMDVQVVAIEVREQLGRAHTELLARRDPRTHMFDADGQLKRLIEYARRHAGEAAGITYIHRDQLSLFDGCLPGDDRGA